jgi:hypothetical protein
VPQAIPTQHYNLLFVDPWGIRDEVAAADFELEAFAQFAGWRSPHRKSCLEM